MLTQPMSEIDSPSTTLARQSLKPSSTPSPANKLYYLKHFQGLLSGGWMAAALKKGSAATSMRSDSRIPIA